MNSIVKVNDNLVLDLILLKAISHYDGALYVHFMNDEHPLSIQCEYDDYQSLYTKWRNYAQWRLDLMLGE